MIKVLLVDDHPAVREGTKAMLEQEEDMEVTVASSSIEALDIFGNKCFDLLLVDLNMPILNGVELTRRAVAINSDSSILIYTGYDISPHFNLLVEVGMTGFISKTASREQLITAIRCALRGEAVIPVMLLRQLRRNDARIGSVGNERSLDEVSINTKEQELLVEVAQGKSNKDIAETLLMSQRTVEYNLTRIFGKLNVRSRAEAIAEARRIGLIPHEDFTK